MVLTILKEISIDGGLSLGLKSRNLRSHALVAENANFSVLPQPSVQMNYTA